MNYNTKELFYMTMKLENLRYAKNCAFCKNWYDPTNSCIRPKQLGIGFWEYDTTAIKKCLISGYNKQSWFSCSKFQCKI